MTEAYSKGKADATAKRPWLNPYVKKSTDFMDDWYEYNKGYNLNGGYSLAVELQADINKTVSVKSFIRR